jgi:hypothetical protein
MIEIDKEFYSKPYYFFLKEKANDFNLYFSIEKNLTEARKKDVMVKVPKDKVEMVKKYIKSLTSKKTDKSTKEVEGEIDELVNSDGSMSNSKIPILDPHLHPKKTMDQTVSAARITNDPIARGYRTYYGESVEEVSEEDMSGAFGFEETKELDGKETFEYFRDELEMDEKEAWERTEEQGKDPSGKKDDKSPYKKDKNFVTRATLSEIQRQKMLKMVEDILMKQKNSNKSDVVKKQESSESEEEQKEVPKMIKKNLDSLLKQMQKQGLSKKDLIKLLKDE